MAEAAFTNPAEGGIPADVGARTKITVATLGVEDLKKRNNEEVVKFFTHYKKQYGDGKTDPYAIYGYETMALALDVLKAAGDKANDRAAGWAELLDYTKDRQSCPRRLLIDANGDTTLTDYGLYIIKDGQPTFNKVIKAHRPQPHSWTSAGDEGRALASPPLICKDRAPRELGSRIRHRAPLLGVGRPYWTSFRSTA